MRTAQSIMEKRLQSWIDASQIMNSNMRDVACDTQKRALPQLVSVQPMFTISDRTSYVNRNAAWRGWRIKDKNLQVILVLSDFQVSIKTPGCVGKTWAGPHNSCKACRPILHIDCVLICMDSAQGFIWCNRGHTEVKRFCILGYLV